MSLARGNCEIHPQLGFRQVARTRSTRAEINSWGAKMNSGALKSTVWGAEINSPGGEIMSPCAVTQRYRAEFKSTLLNQEPRSLNLGPEC